jgi:acetoin utilization deacetylase AcuC-like enzyme
MPKFATYLYPHTCFTSKPSDQIEFVGHSLPHFSRVREKLEKELADYPTLSLRKAEYTGYRSVHTKEYLDKLTLMALDEPVQELPKLSIECTGFEYCLPGYLYGLGGMLEAIDEMRAGALERVYCFSLGGHHAYADRGHGYCLLNPQAAAARYAQTQGFEKILIVDWDIHHGDGTQSIFANDPNVYCISIHSAADLYMALACGLKYGTTTMGEQVGHCNIPLLDQRYDDDFAEKMKLDGKFYRTHESLSVFQTALEQIPWSPDLIFVFSGYDAHEDDCGRGITDWTDQDFKSLTQNVLELAKKAACPVLSTHGGGYKLSVTVSAALNHVEVLANYRL